MNRIIEEMPDVCIDVPAAYNVLEKMGDKMFQMGVLSESMYKDLPTRYTLCAHRRARTFWKENHLSSLNVFAYKEVEVQDLETFFFPGDAKDSCLRVTAGKSRTRLGQHSEPVTLPSLDPVNSTDIGVVASLLAFGTGVYLSRTEPFSSDIL